MTETDAADEITGDVAEHADASRHHRAGDLWRAVWTLASDTARSHLIAAAREQDAEHPETAGRMPWASDVAAWAAELREVARG